MLFATSATKASTLSVFEELVLVSWQEFAHGFQILHSHLLNVNVERADQECLAAIVLSDELEPLQCIALFATVRAKRIFLETLNDVLFCAMAARAGKCEARGKILKQHLCLV